MRLPRRLLLAIASLLCCCCLSPAALAADTVVVIVRHAEKATDDPRDPSLSEAGQARAEALAKAIAGLHIQAAYVSQFRRTRLTATPAAQAAGIEAVTLQAGKDTQADAQALASRIRQQHQGQSVLVVGHSNTINAMVETFGGSVPAEVAEDEFDRLYLLVIDDAGKLRVAVSRY